MNDPSHLVWSVEDIAKQICKSLVIPRSLPRVENRRFLNESWQFTKFMGIKNSITNWRGYIWRKRVVFLDDDSFEVEMSVIHYLSDFIGVSTYYPMESAPLTAKFTILDGKGVTIATGKHSFHSGKWFPIIKLSKKAIQDSAGNINPQISFRQELL